MSLGRNQWLEKRVTWPLLWLLVFTIPWEKSLMVPGVGTITRLIGLLAAVSVVAVVILRGRPRSPNAALVAMALFVLWSAATYGWSLDPDATADRAATLLQLLIMAWLVWELCRTPARQKLLIAAYACGAAVSSLLTLSRYVRGLETYYRRYAASGFEPNDLGLTLALSIPLTLYLSRQASGALRLVWSLLAALAIAAVLVSGSRTAFLASCLAFLFLAWTWRGASGSWRLLSTALLVLLVAGAFHLAPPRARQRIAALPQEVAQGTFHGRTQIWKAGVKVFRTRPIRGVGAGAYPESVRPRLGVPGRPGHRYVAHNTYLSVLVECGLVGFALFALAGGLLVVYVWLLPPLERALWAVMLLVCGTGLFTLTWEHRKPVWLIAALIMTGWSIPFARRQEKP